MFFLFKISFSLSSIQHSHTQRRIRSASTTNRPFKRIKLPSLIEQPTFSDLSDDSEDEIQDSTKKKNGDSNLGGLLGSIPAPKKKLNVVPTITTTVTSKKKKKKKIEEEEIEKDQEQGEQSNITIFGNLAVPESRKLDASTSSSASSIKTISSAPQVVSSTPLPEGWHEATDPSSGDTYYYNSVTKETSWDRPTEPSTRKRPRAAISTGVSSADRHIASQIGVNMADIQEVDIRSIHDPTAWGAPVDSGRKKKGVSARVWMGQKGASSTTSRVSRTAKCKNQLHALANHARAQAEAIAERRARGMRNRAQVKSRYGW